jgi:hypothetical protein
LITPFAKVIALKIAYNVRPSGIDTYPGTSNKLSLSVFAGCNGRDNKDYMKNDGCFDPVSSKLTCGPGMAKENPDQLRP